LLELLQARGPFSEHEAAGYISQLCDILRPLHQQNPPIVHRDIKPSNLLVTYDGRLILIDFNTAKESEGDKGHQTVLIGHHQICSTGAVWLFRIQAYSRYLCNRRPFK
jgi:serine/threonine protein kinase